MTGFGDFLTTNLVFFTIAFAGALAIVTKEQFAKASGSVRSWALTFAVPLIAFLVTWATTDEPRAVVPLVVSATGLLIGARYLPRLTTPGRLFLGAYVCMVSVGLVWGFWFVATIPVSAMTRVLLLAGYPLLLFSLPSAVLQSLTDWECLCRRQWLRPRTPLPPTPRVRYPKVSLHVPTYDEPSDVVIETLDALARLDYPDFEVLIVDNNTRDPARWLPVQAHCQLLGPRFRFFHLDKLAGAKAGALNFALNKAAEDAELIGVIDADYHAVPEFLSSLVGYFDDPAMGFVQTPHDYRDYNQSRFLRICYWEYRYFFATTMVILNEYDSALTVGTMCLIRRRALEEAGGWAEWCVTEDSELSIRIHACGYSSVYLPVSFGYGLIPETFEGYKRQRFRWTYGPIQEFKHHFRLFIPQRWRGSRRSSLSPMQQLLHLNHGLDRLIVGLQFVLLPLGAAIALSMLVHGETVPVPIALWLTATVVLVGGWVLWWLPYRVLLRASLSETVWAFVASKALSHTVTMSSVKALYTNGIPWRRTNKFPATSAGLRVLHTTRAELILGFLLLLGSISLFILLPHAGLLLMLAIGAFLQSLNYLAAPALAVLAEREVAGRNLALGQDRPISEC